MGGDVSINAGIKSRCKECPASNQSIAAKLPNVNGKATTAPVDLMLAAEIKHGSGNNSTNFSASISPTPVPLPAGLWLFVSALSNGYYFFA